MAFPALPILRTARLSLRPLSESDLDAIFVLRSDPEINRYLDRQTAQSLSEAFEFIKKVNQNTDEGKTFYWAISLNESKNLVGTICLFNFSDVHLSCEMGYELLKTFQGRGIMREAAREVIHFVFQTLKYQKITAYTHAQNQKSTQLLIGLGFVKCTPTDLENTDLENFTLTV